MKNYARELKLEEMENVNGGVHGEIFVYQQELENEKLAAQRADFLKRKKEAQDLADIRMRASEDALKAAMRLNKQEADIKEAMKAQREALGLN